MIDDRGGAGLARTPAGYEGGVSSPATSSELRIPADPDYIIVAKRAAASFGYIAGFGVEAVDELSIAVTQACENAIRCAQDAGNGPGQIRIVFKLEDRGLDVQVRSSCVGRPVEDSETAAARAAAEVARRRLASQRAALAEAGMTDLALRMMGLFVDDCRYRVDQRTGGLRVRLTKYRVS